MSLNRGNELEISSEGEDEIELKVPGNICYSQSTLASTGVFKPEKFYRWEFNHVGNEVGETGEELDDSWQKLSIHLNFILDRLNAVDGPKAYRYISKGGRGYIADIDKMTLTRLGINDVPLKAWEMRKVELKGEDVRTRIQLQEFQTQVFSSSKIEVTEICTRRQRFEIKGYINVFWRVTELNKDDVAEDNLQELAGKTYWRIKKLEDRKLNVPISLSNPIQNALEAKFSWSATYYKSEKVIHLVIKIESATLYEDMSLKAFPFDRQFLNVCLSCRRTVQYKTQPVESRTEAGAVVQEDDFFKIPKAFTTTNALRLQGDSSHSQFRIPVMSFATSKGLVLKHAGWAWTTKCPKWIPRSSHYHLLKIPVHATLQGSVADEWKIERPWCDYAWGIFLNTAFIRIPIERHSNYHLSHTMFPLFMIVCAAFGAFFVPIADVADRLSVSLTAMLTAVAFQFNVTSNLPDAGYNTAIDVYIMFAFLTLFAVIMENMLMGSFEESDGCEKADNVLGVLLYILWAICNLVFYVRSFSFCRVRWNDLSKMEFTRGGIQWFTSDRNNCYDYGPWGMTSVSGSDIHPQGVIVDRSLLIEETKQMWKNQQWRNEASDTVYLK